MIFKKPVEYLMSGKLLLMTIHYQLDALIIIYS